MKPDAEKHLRIANETLLEMEHLIAGGLYEAAAKRTYNAMLNPATTALPAKEVQSGRQAQTNLLRAKEFIDACRVLCD